MISASPLPPLLTLPIYLSTGQRLRLCFVACLTGCAIEVQYLGGVVPPSSVHLASLLLLLLHQPLVAPSMIAIASIFKRIIFVFLQFCLHIYVIKMDVCLFVYPFMTLILSMRSGAMDWHIFFAGSQRDYLLWAPTLNVISSIARIG